MVEAELRDSDGNLVARGTGTFMRSDIPLDERVGYERAASRGRAVFAASAGRLRRQRRCAQWRSAGGLATRRSRGNNCLARLAPLTSL